MTPQAADPEASKSPFLRYRLPLRRRRVLVVEDDVDLRTVIERVARSIDHDLMLEWASSVAAACSLLDRHMYDLVVADHLLDGRSTGLSLGRWCVQKHPATRFAMMSAYLGRDDLRSSVHGVFPFLPKPFSVADCRAFLRRALPPAAV